MTGNDAVDELMKLISWSCIMMTLKSKNAWRKRKEQIFRRGSWLVHHLQNMFYQRIYAFWYYVANNEVPSSSFQIVEQLSTRQETRKANTIFSKKHSRKSKMGFTLPIIFAIPPIDESCYRVIDSSNIWEFHLSQTFYHAMKENRWS